MKAATNLAVVADAAEAPPKEYGMPFAGGYYGGRILTAGLLYALIVPPNAIGYHDRIAWKTDWGMPTPGTQSLCDGFANTEAMIAAGGHPIADWITEQVRIKWFADAYLPSRDELELLYRNLKPGTYENWTYRSRLARWGAKPGQYNGVDKHGNGHNIHSMPPGKAYTKKSPKQTGAELFREGGPEAFVPGYYWSSSEFAPAGAWIQGFAGGLQTGGRKNHALRARAVRKVLIPQFDNSLAA